MAREASFGPLLGVRITNDEQENWVILTWLNKLWEKVTGRRSYVVTFTPAEVSAGPTIEEQAFTVNGLTTDDIVIVNKPSLDTYIGIVGVRVSDTDELSISYINTDTSAHTPTSEDYEIIAIRKDNIKG